MDSKGPTIRPIEVVKGVTIDTCLHETIGSSIAPNLPREVSNTPLSPLDSPRLKDLDKLMSQSIMDLAATLEDEPPIGDAFEFLSLLDSKPFDGKCNFGIFSAFSMGEVGITIPKVNPIGTN